MAYFSQVYTEILRTFHDIKLTLELHVNRISLWLHNHAVCC